MARNREGCPDQVFLVWLREGTYGDTEPKAVRASKEGAVSWCNEHRKLQGADPVTWVSPEPAEGPAGDAKARDSYGNYHYFIESMPLGD